MKVQTLRAYLARLIWLCVLPLVLLAVYLAIDHVGTLQAQRDREAADRARDVATAIDHQIKAQIAALQLLAASPLLDDQSHYQQFYNEARGFRESFGGHVILADLSMQMLLNTRVPFGTTLPKLPQPKGHAAAPTALATGKPAVGDTFPGPLAREPLVAVVVPVSRNSATRFLLLSTLETRRFQRLIDDLTLPPGWSLTLLDGKSEVLAHRADTASAGGETKSGRFVANSAVASWSVVLEIPRSVYRAPVVSAAVAFAVAILAVSIVSILAGRLASRRLARSVAGLAKTPSPGETRPIIAEIEEIRGILAEAEAVREEADSARRESEKRIRTLLEQAAEKTLHSLRDMTALDALAQQIAAKISLDRVVDASFAGISEIVPSDLTLFFMRNGEELELLRSGPSDSPYKHDATPVHCLGECLCGIAARTGRPVYSADIHGDPRCTWEECKRAGLRSFAALPLLSETKVLGVFCLASGGEVDYEKRGAFLEAYSGEIALGLKNALLIEELWKRTAELEKEIAERTLVAAELLQQRGLLSTILESAAEAIFAKDTTGRYHAINEAGARMLGFGAPDVLGRTDMELLPAETAGDFRKTDELVMSGGQAYEREEIGVIGSRTRIFLAHKTPWRDNSGNIIGVIGISSDITDRKRIEKSLTESEALYRDMFECNPQPMWVYDLETLAFLAVNDAAIAHYQYSRDEFLAMTIRGIRPPEDIPRLLANISMVRGGIDQAGTWLHCKKDGSVIMVEITSHTLDYNGRPAELVLAHDITERKRAEAALAEKESRYRDLVENSNDLICTHDLNGTILSANPAAVKALGYPADELLSMNLRDILSPGKRDRLTVYLRRLRRRGSARGVMFVLTASGEERIWDYDNTLRTEGVPAPVVRGMARDVTEQKQAEEKLARSEEEYRRLSQEFQGLLNAIPDSLMLLDTDLKVLWANRAAVETIGGTAEGLDGRYCYALWYSRSAACDPCPVARSFTTGQPQSEIVTRSDGRIWDIRTVPLVDAQGRTARVIEVKRNITEHRRIEEQLRHTQKLEGIGQLAGGIAHDFNNVIGAVIGFAGVLQIRMAEDDPLRHFVDEIVAAGERAAELTRQILAFSRKQVFDLKPARLNGIVRGLEKMLRRLLPENIDIAQDLSGEDPPVLVDAGQIGQVLLNLVTNARDAIAESGRIGIATGRFSIDRSFVELYGCGEPGEYAVLTVSDTGRGMDASTRARIFEPFFTTKEIGKGTGLGLAVVHGIVKQHRGFINVYSEVGKGAVIRVYLPLAAGTVSEQSVVEPPARVAGGSETILVAEDDAILRKLSRTVLGQYGYTVIEAEDGEDAVAKYAENQDAIRLVILDGLMPKKGGVETLEEIRRLCPGIKAVFMSGYANDIFSGGDLRDKAAFIQKPVMPGDLLRTVREVLDR